MLSHKTVQISFYYYYLQDEMNYNVGRCHHYINLRQFSRYHAAQLDYKEKQSLPV